MPSVTFLQYSVLCFYLNISQKYCRIFENTVFFLSVYHYTCVLHNGTKYCFSFKILFFSLENTANLFARLASLCNPLYWLLSVANSQHGRRAVSVNISEN